MDEEKEKYSLISRIIDVDKTAHLKDEDILILLANRIAEMLDKESELLMSTLYRLDIEEEKILKVLHNPAISAPEGLARLILERQKEKLATRKRYSDQEKWDWDDF